MSGAGEESIYGLIPEPMHIPPKQPLYRSKFPGAAGALCGTWAEGGEACVQCQVRYVGGVGNETDRVRPRGSGRALAPEPAFAGRTGAGGCARCRGAGGGQHATA
jgi:hypothetical protein